MALKDSNTQPLLSSRRTVVFTDESESDSTALAHTRKKQCTACVDRLEMVAMKSIGVNKKDPRNRGAARRHVRFSEWFHKSWSFWVWQKLNGLHQYSQSLADSARHCRLWRKKRNVVYFRVANVKDVQIDDREDKQLPHSHPTLYLHSVKKPPDGWGSLVPKDFDKTGWRSWKIPQYLHDYIHQLCGEDVSKDVKKLTQPIKLSQAFAISGDSHDMQIHEKADTFSFSYPHPEAAVMLQNIEADKFNKYPILALLKNGGFMYFKCNTHEERRNKLWRHCCISPKAALFDIVDVKAVSLEDDQNKGAVPLDFGYAHVFKPPEAVNFYGHEQPITIKKLRAQGVTHFKWIAPQESLGHEPMPCGFPYGGFAYLVEEHQSNKQQDEAAENAARDEDAKLNSPWWQIHLDELTESNEQEHSADRAYKTQLLEKIESLCESPHKDDWPKRFMRAQVITNIFWQLRYAFNVPIYESRPLQIYFNIFSFRMGFALLMSLLLTVAGYLGVQMQIFFTVFGAMYQPHSCPSFVNRVVFCLLPILMVGFALIIDQLVDLTSDALTPPAFVKTRAKLIAVLSICNPHNKPGLCACLAVDALGFFGCELLPDIGAIYNFLGMWYGDRLTHMFYMGHEGYKEAIFGGYITGHLYFCFGITILFSVLDVVIESMEYFQRARDSIHWPMQTIEHALEEHRVRPYFTWIHQHMFHKAFYQGEVVNEFGIMEDARPRTPATPAQQGQVSSMDKYYVDESDAVSYSKFWGYVCTLLSLIPWGFVCYVIGVTCPDKAPLVQYTKYSNSEIGVESHFLMLASASLVLAVFGVAHKIKKDLPNLVGAPFTGALVITSILTSGLLYEGQGFSPKGKAEQESMSPLMTLVNEQGALHGGLPAWWPNPGVAQEYPLCRLGWGAPTAQVSSLELGALSYISYSTSCYDGNSSVSVLLNQSFFPAPELIQCNDYSKIPRWIAVRFRGKSENDEDTIVVAVKGTSTVADGYLDTDLFTTIKVLQLFSFMAPVLMVVPKDMIVWLIGTLKVMAVGHGSAYEQKIWNSLASELRELQSNNTKSKIVLTGHSLGGAIAEIVAARLGFSALVWSAPGAVYLQRFFNITEEQEQRDVVVVIPDFDVVPRVDKHAAVVQRIQCWAKNHQVEDPLKCHSIAKSSCEVWRVCGDDKRRNFNNTCFPYISNAELGTLYPVLNAPIIAT